MSCPTCEGLQGPTRDVLQGDPMRLLAGFEYMNVVGSPKRCMLSFSLDLYSCVYRSIEKRSRFARAVLKVMAGSQ